MRSAMSSIKSPTGIHPHSNPLSGSGTTSSSTSSVHKPSSKQLHSGTASSNHATTPSTPTITTSNHGHPVGGHSVGGHSIGSNPQSSSKLYHTAPSSAVPSQTSSTRRIWIKRVGGTPTTLTVTKSDIIDDLKSLVLQKFANSLGRSFDSADLILKMDLSSRVPTNINSSNAKKSTTIGSGSSGKLSPEPPRSRASSNLSNHPNRSSNTINNNVNNNANNYSFINLEPDQNVWTILEQYYPHGMGMSECLIVDTPDQPEMIYGQLQPADFGLQQRHLQYGNYDHSQLQPQLQQQQQQRSQIQSTGQEHQTSSHLVKPPAFPVDQSNSTANSSAGNTPLYYQPKPQNLYLNKSLASGSQGSNSILDSIGKDRSISPSTLNGTSPSGHHRRAHSNPPQSPLHYTGNQHHSNNSNNNSSSNSNPNQAILLLPKNFSLTSGNSSVSQDNNNNSSDKKRMSFDDGYLRRNRNLSLKPSHSGTNITNIGMGITSPTSNNSISYVSIPENGNFKSPDQLEFSKKLNDTETSEKDTKSLQPIKNPSVKEQTDSNKEAKASKPGKAEEEQKKLSSAQSAKENLTSDNSQSKNGVKASKPATSSTSKSSNLLSIQASDSKSNLHTNSNNNSNSNQFNVKQQSKSTTERVLPSISVLVVEDNAINQAILGAFLRKHKIHYQIAKNGQEAIDKWRQGGFHLVLMDIQLPVKSGIEATKEIRYLEKINRIGVFAENELINSHYSSNPELKREEYLDLNVFRSPVIIVALTASSNSSTDKKKALMAGCNDYLTKPVNLVWLQNKITEWGCMQALIDFDGWDRKRVTNIEKKTPKAHTPRTEKGVLLEAPVQITTN
ncbi:oxidative stress response two-component system protein Ssk1p [[Candida] railenensis]|uniref:Oxidative stress response two-component system protein Ssk1p n=1 Tax=[Candida] railenensis TaxID=45579 RepID=A0A9P0VWP2_9ASCO|nr:oxidative stress response two-component system protein Ssk1p [[Candida] railenensis]